MWRPNQNIVESLQLDHKMSWQTWNSDPVYSLCMAYGCIQQRITSRWLCFIA
jgi:hypothetical protein